MPHIHVACGVLQNSSGKVLIAQRPPGKIAAGKWEFPGGKIESGESPREALDRELHEELGVSPKTARPLIRYTHAYSDRVVTLETWLVNSWQGDLEGREKQQFAWFDPRAPLNIDVLPTVSPSLGALRLPLAYVFTAPRASPAEIIAGLNLLPRGALLRIRLPSLSDEAYEHVVLEVLPEARKIGLSLIVDRGEDMAARIGADGVHFDQNTLMGTAPADQNDLLRLASCHDSDSLAHAKQIKFDAAVLGNVRPTASHPERSAMGWNRFSELAGKANLPVYAIGGLGPEDQDEAFAHNAQGVAGISAYWSKSGS